MAEDAAARTSAAAALPPRVAFLGFGLIAGSIAAAIRTAGGARSRLVAWTPEGIGPREGLRRGFLDESATTARAAIEGAGLIVLAGPPLAILGALGDLAAPLRDAAAAGATITDVGSTKRRIVDAARASSIPFVGGHPMAGRETTGAASATADLFEDRPWVVVDGEGALPRDVDRVEALARATGALPVRMDADAHDAAVAAISHLPLVVAAALVEAVAAGHAPDWPVARSLAASGWADMTRLAKGDPEMGAGILTTNAPAVRARLSSIRDALDAWIAALDASAADAESIRVRLESARARLLERPAHDA